ncbi:hypothetical protein BJ165DRAFT_1527571 [Panaeolus papilionaceus]|nr:hypothetical protein BJ165DRAFT_1527571 [Panaeolus papilionaceus]
MKRTSSVLVEYSDSSGDESKKLMPVKIKPQEQPPKKRKLPPVSSTIVTAAPIDNPALHQGRIRSTPHVDGQFAAHIYVSISLTANARLNQMVQSIFMDAKIQVPILHETWKSDKYEQKPELHISLSRPVFLWAHQREDLRLAVKKVAKTHKPFVVSFATLSELINDEKTRTFLAMEVGAGHHELSSIATSLGPSLRSIRQQEYYVNPRFHASIGWALLHQAKDNSQSPVMSDSFCTANDTEVKLTSPSSLEPTTPPFHTIPHFPTKLIPSLIESHQDLPRTKAMQCVTFLADKAANTALQLLFLLKRIITACLSFKRLLDEGCKISTSTTTSTVIDPARPLV